MESVNFASWMSVLTWFNMSKFKVINKVTPRSRLFQGQIISDFLSASGRWAFD